MNYQYNMEEHKALAVDLAYEAGKIMKENFMLGMKKEWKSDNSTLTATDLAVNKLVLETITRKFPEHSILSEEGSRMVEGSEYTWVCDPVDGTAAFSHGYPLFTFSLALTQNGRSILGVVYDPIMDRLLFAEKGKGATMNGKKIHVSADDTFERVHISLHANNTLYKVRDLTRGKAWVSTFFAAVYGGLLVACGEYAAEVFEFPNPWDAAALKVIIEEAGGKMTDIDGKDQRYDQEINGFVASNGILHDKIIDLIKTIK